MLPSLKKCKLTYHGNIVITESGTLEKNTFCRSNSKFTRMWPMKYFFSFTLLSSCCGRYGCGRYGRTPVEKESLQTAFEGVESG